MTATMTKSEREDLQRLVRQRERALKSAAKQRSAELLAEFENQLAAEYSYRRAHELTFWSQGWSHRERRRPGSATRRFQAAQQASTMAR